MSYHTRIDITVEKQDKYSDEKILTPEACALSYLLTFVHYLTRKTAKICKIRVMVYFNVQRIAQMHLQNYCENNYEYAESCMHFYINIFMEC